MPLMKFSMSLGGIKPVDAARRWLANQLTARHWLAQQLEECPIRLDPVLRSSLFQEVEAATASLDGMYHHSEAIRDSNHWCNYEVFLKAAWTYLCANRRAKSRIGAVVLLKMVQFYRRRPGRVYQRAAAQRQRDLQDLLETLGPEARTRWLEGIAAYEEAYMSFLMASSSQATEDVFLKSVNLESKYGRPLGELISLAQSYVVGIRRVGAPPQELEKKMRELARVQDNLASIRGPLANSWIEESVPAHMAYANLALGRHSDAAGLVAALVEKGYSSAMWYMGLALARDGAIAEGIKQLEAARKAFYRDQRAEGRAAVLVGLGDAYQIAGRREDALAAYGEALRQPVHMDNAVSIKAAKLRLSEDGLIIRSLSEMHLA
jgi:hypothetical protein